MADDPNVALRAEYQKARDALVPMIRGIDDLDHISLSDRAKDFDRQLFEMRKRRAGLLDRAMTAIDNLSVAIRALAQDGYPDVAKVIVPPDVAAEFARQLADIEEAFAQFQIEPQVNSGTIGFAEFKDVPQPS
jgi:hypothetical protein